VIYAREVKKLYRSTSGEFNNKWSTEETVDTNSELYYEVIISSRKECDFGDINNMWKLYRLLESVISDRRLYFIVELEKELNVILNIETRLLIVFYLQINKQTEWIN